MANRERPFRQEAQLRARQEATERRWSSDDERERWELERAEEIEERLEDDGGSAALRHLRDDRQ